ncbi:hypothetical protein BD779DRAFT_1531450 [Infundibulicybe gibba]|nr:hypothetical protein BD779DRAFT_1531450 [Infundibulicybe gibba]
MPSLIDSTLGAVFIGFAVACCVYGVLVTQIFSYFRQYPLDKPFTKATVVIILLLETADQAFIGHLVYYYCITSFANVEALIQATVTWSFILQEIVGVIAGVIVKASFALRVWRFSGRNVYITGLIFVLTFAQLGLAIVYTIKAFALPSVFAASRIRVLGSISLATGAVTDIITAVSLCYFLNKLRTGYSTSDSLVDSLCRYAINTGVLTSFLSLTTLVLYDVLPDTNLAFVATYFILSKLYATSYIATLNTRRTTRSRLGTSERAVRGASITTNHTNLFHLGTRMPSMGPVDIEYQEEWDSEKDNEPQAFSLANLQMHSPKYVT